jgi:hypothetical protein
MPGNWQPNTPVTANQLNRDMYTYDGSYFSAQGVMFHANRPVCHEAYTENTTFGSNPAGYWIQFGGINGEGLGIVDTSALFGIGCDSPARGARYQSSGVTANGSSGVAGIRGGWVLMIHFLSVTPASGTPAAIGAGWYYGSTVRLDVGSVQVASTLRDNSAFAIDLIDVTGATQYYIPAINCSDPNSVKYTARTNTTPNTVGETPRFTQLWCSVDTANGATVSTVPTPQTAFTSSTPITSTLMNSTVKNTLNLLNYPPIFNVQQAQALTINASTQTTVPFSGGVLIDNYAGFSTSTHTYTVQLAGVYFCHATVAIKQGTGGNVSCGFIVNGSTMWGPNYQGVSVSGQQPSVTITRVLDLNVGDTLKVFVYSTNASQIVTPTYNSHFIMVWLNALATVSNLTWTAPDVHGQLLPAAAPPGTAPGQLVDIFNSKISNDLNFLLNKPYLLAYQSVAQTGIAVNVWTTVVMDQLKGLVHASTGDNYGGWTSGTSNSYAAKVAGWYLVTEEVSIAPTATAGNVVAGISCPVSGGVTAPVGGNGPPDWYQSMPPVSSGGPSAATACGLYYLAVGETVAPQIEFRATSGTFATSVSSFNSTFSCLWVCE